MNFLWNLVYFSLFVVLTGISACGKGGAAEKSPPQEPSTNPDENAEPPASNPPKETPTESPEDAKKRLKILDIYAGYEAAELKAVPVILPDEAYTLHKQGSAVFVDTREPHEREVSMLPGAITIDDLRANRAQYANKVIIPYCTIGYRSGFSTRELLEQFSDVRNLKGSVLLWSHSGLPFFQLGKETKKVHVYGEDWNLLASGYLAVY